eukprot:1194063-Prorocentrum_minimum.AAC.2
MTGWGGRRTISISSHLSSINQQLDALQYAPPAEVLGEASPSRSKGGSQDHEEARIACPLLDPLQPPVRPPRRPKHRTMEAIYPALARGRVGCEVFPPHGGSSLRPCCYSQPLRHHCYTQPLRHHTHSQARVSGPFPPSVPAHASPAAHDESGRIVGAVARMRAIGRLQGTQGRQARTSSWGAAFQHRFLIDY